MDQLTPNAAAILLDVCTRHRGSRRHEPRVRRVRRSPLTMPAPVAPVSIATQAPPAPELPSAVSSILAIVGKTSPALAANERYRDFLLRQSPARISGILHNTLTMLGGVPLASANQRAA